MGLSRDTFYRYRDAVEEGGVEALLERTRRGIVKLTDRRLFSAFLHEAKPLKLRRAATDNEPRFRSESGST